MARPPLLGRIQSSNEGWLRKVDTGARFRGVLHPVNPTQLPTSVFVLPRIALRVRLHEPVKSSELVRDAANRILLVADHDLTLTGSDPYSRVHALFQMTKRVAHTRAYRCQNPITKQFETSETEDLGQVWISDESFTRADNDPGTRLVVDRLRFVTGTPVALGDMLGDKIVKRVLPTLGIYIAEVE